MTLQCTFPGCPNEMHGRGLCGSHYQQQRRGTILHAIGDGAPPRLCDFDGCGRPHYAYGLCEAHRDQQRRGKTLAPIQVKRKLADKCLHCDLPPVARDLCVKHHSEWTRRKRGAKVRGPRDVTLNPRVTSDKPRRNPKPQGNPNLPRNWDRVTDKTPPPYRQKSSNAEMGADFGAMLPLDSWMPRRVRQMLARREALDLVGMLGLDDMAAS